MGTHTVKISLSSKAWCKKEIEDMRAALAVKSMCSDICHNPWVPDSFMCCRLMFMVPCSQQLMKHITVLNGHTPNFWMRLISLVLQLDIKVKYRLCRGHSEASSKGVFLCSTFPRSHVVNQWLCVVKRSCAVFANLSLRRLVTSWCSNLVERLC